jgi:hypothetical protein
MWSIKTPEQTPEQNDYAAKLYARLGEAVVLRRMELEVGGWQPLAKGCHTNATQVHLRDASYAPVRGWLYFDFGGYLDHVQFLAHSVVRAPNGELWDITPVQPAQAYPFILAVESEEDYAALIAGGVVRLWHPKRPA